MYERTAVLSSIVLDSNRQLVKDSTVVDLEEIYFSAASEYTLPNNHSNRQTKTRCDVEN